MTMLSDQQRATLKFKLAELEEANIEILKDISRSQKPVESEKRRAAASADLYRYIDVEL